MVFALVKGPVATALANNIDLFQQRALVPALADLRDLSLTVKADDVDLYEPLAMRWHK